MKQNKKKIKGVHNFSFFEGINVTFVGKASKQKTVDTTKVKKINNNHENRNDLF